MEMRSMIEFTNSVVVDRPVRGVYDYLSDLENVPDWNWAISRTEKLTSGPPRVGTRYRQTRTVPQPATETLEISGLEPDRVVEIQGTLAGMPAKLRYTLTESGLGTEITNTVHLVVRGVLQLAAPALGRRIDRAVASNLKDLKKELERRQSPQNSKGN
jgi:uncharacterized protein YndB with AHSA1/START domain